MSTLVLRHDVVCVLNDSLVPLADTLLILFKKSLLLVLEMILNNLMMEQVLLSSMKFQSIQ